jgi:uncharacterized protein (DUF488 family)
MPLSASTVYTIGHSTRTIEEFLALLRIHGIRQLADVRTVPRSRRHPQFEKDALDAALATAGVAYRHYPSLGGLRKPRRDSINTAWQHPSFRGYADHMETVEFRHGVEALIKSALEGPTVVMCAESVWWRCHRRLLADALLVRGVPVLHILSDAEPKPHALSEFARAESGGVTYPGLL